VPGLTRTVKRIVVMLAGWPGSSVNRDRIIEAVWGATIPSDAHNSLQGHVAALRRAIGRDRIATTQDGYALVVGTDCVDAEHFSDLAMRGMRGLHQGDLVLAHPLLMEARDLWRGTPFSDVEDAQLIARRERLGEIYERVREAILECRLGGAGSSYEAAEVVPWAKEEVARAPLRERRHEILMEALLRADRPAEAIDAYQAAVEVLHARSASTRGGPGRCTAPCAVRPARDPAVHGRRSTLIAGPPGNRVTTLVAGRLAWVISPRTIQRAIQRTLPRMKSLMKSRMMPLIWSFASGAWTSTSGWTVIRRDRPSSCSMAFPRTTRAGIHGSHR
jgi:DNA-binding SARP family transcriptional activator